MAHRGPPRLYGAAPPPLESLIGYWATWKTTDLLWAPRGLDNDRVADAAAGRAMLRAARQAFFRKCRSQVRVSSGINITRWPLCADDASAGARIFAWA